MAIPRIESYAFTGWKGRLHLAVRRIARLPPRPGVNGEAKVIDAWGTLPEPVVTSATFQTLPAASDAIAGYRAMMDGTVKTAVDPLGRSFSIKVDAVTGDPSYEPTGLYRLIATWTVQVEASAP